MNETFRQHVETLEASLQRLLDGPSMKLGELPARMPERGVYLFSEGDRHLYTGRSNRMRRRLRSHANRSHRQAAFAFLLAREATDRTTASYKKRGSRDALMRDPHFKAAFFKATDRIRAMEVRFVEEVDPTRQTLLEIYVATALGTPYNNFDNH